MIQLKFCYAFGGALKSLEPSENENGRCNELVSQERGIIVNGWYAHKKNGRRVVLSLIDIWKNATLSHGKNNNNANTIPAMFVSWNLRTLEHSTYSVKKLNLTRISDFVKHRVWRKRFYIFNLRKFRKRINATDKFPKVDVSFRRIFTANIRAGWQELSRGRCETDYLLSRFWTKKSSEIQIQIEKKCHGISRFISGCSR